MRTTFNSVEDITITSVQHLTYMLAVLDEVMRMYPPVVSGLPRLTAEGGAMIAGEYVPQDVSHILYVLAVGIKISDSLI